MKEFYGSTISKKIKIELSKEDLIQISNGKILEGYKVSIGLESEK